MAAVPTVNNGSTFFNQNDCRSFRQNIGTNLTQLSAFPCSEVIIVNRTASDITIYDNGNFSIDNSFLLGASESFTFRGITNTAVVSAVALSAGNIYCRTQYFSMLPQR
jgi:hypothetical protein